LFVARCYYWRFERHLPYSFLSCLTTYFSSFVYNYPSAKELGTNSPSFLDWQLSKYISCGLVNKELYSETVLKREIRSVNTVKIKDKM
jgi:hypothetical protein